MKIVRYGSFETNSSSTHAIVIPKKVSEDSYDLYDSLDHDYAFGREECRLCEHWDEKLAYAYMLLTTNCDWSQNDNGWKPNNTTTKEDIDMFKKRITAMWEVVESKLQREYNPTPQDVFNYIDRDGTDGNLTGDDSFIVLKKRWGNYVDHANDLDHTDIIERLKTDDEFVKRFIFSRESYITVGGDEYRGYNIKTIGFEYDYESGDHRMNEKGELPPKEWLDERGCIKEEYWDRYWNEYTLETGEFWAKLREYEKENDVFLKGN